ncbi:hypothetical protein B566_EDAN003076 [Ephemera danica]|nr:hypothetical protein B566_EDAN003076 [Ephemera danica]
MELSTTFLGALTLATCGVRFRIHIGVDAEVKADIPVSHGRKRIQYTRARIIVTWKFRFKINDSLKTLTCGLVSPLMLIHTVRVKKADHRHAAWSPREHSDFVLVRMLMLSYLLLCRGRVQLLPCSLNFLSHPHYHRWTSILDVTMMMVRMPGSADDGQKQQQQREQQQQVHLEALAVDDARAGLIVLLLGDPHLLEGGQGGEDGATDPYGVLPLRGSDDLDLDGAGSKSGDFLLHAVSNTRVHGGASRQDSVGVQVLTDVNVALHDGVVHGLVDTARFHTQEGRLEESLRATETLVANGDDLTVGKFIGLLEGGGSSGGGHFLLEVQGDVAQLLLDVTNDFTLSCGGQNLT